MGGLSKEGHHPSTDSPTYQIIKVTNANHMSMMKTSLTVIPMCPRERFALYKSSSRLVLCYKKDWATLLHLSYFCYLFPLRIILSQNYQLSIISVLADNTLLKTACYFLLLLVGFDTLTYRHDYTCGSSRGLALPSSTPLYTGRWHPIDTQVDCLAVCGASLHRFPPRSYHRSA